MQNFFEHRLNIGKYQTAVFFCFAALLFSCNSTQKNKESLSNPEIISIETLNSIDTINWVFYKSWSLNDTALLVLAKSKYFHTTHSGGPQLALVLLKKTRNNWVVRESKLHLPVITSWGEIPKFKLESINEIHLLTADYGYGNQGNDRRILKFFDIDLCHFGETCFQYAYNSRILETVAEIDISNYEGNITRLYNQKISYNLNQKNRELRIYSTSHNLTYFEGLEILEENKIEKIELPPINEVFQPILCS